MMAAGQRIRVVFAGTPFFSVACFQGLLAQPNVDVVGVVSQPDRKSGRGMKLSPSPVKQAAMNAGIDVITPDSLRGNDEALIWLQNKRADILVVVAFGMILPKSWLEAVRVAPINVHASLLPRWRGAAPIERALLAGDAQTGVGIMQMEESLDTGGIYAQRQWPITASTTGASLWADLEHLGAQLLVDTIDDIAAKRVLPVAQAELGVTYAKKISNDERILDWAMSAVLIERYIRCFSPKPGVRTEYSGRQLKIVRGEVLMYHENKEAGTVVGIKDGLDVVCGDGVVLRIHSLQPEGKKEMAAMDFLRGASITMGDQFK